MKLYGLLEAGNLETEKEQRKSLKRSVPHLQIWKTSDTLSSYTVVKLQIVQLI
jgi:hypothetical protein